MTTGMAGSLDENEAAFPAVFPECAPLTAWIPRGSPRGDESLCGAPGGQQRRGLAPAAGKPIALEMNTNPAPPIDHRRLSYTARRRRTTRQGPLCGVQS
ncbi:MAG: hypothetical protein MZV70_33330 [Desulfobacterales bacterium]|nr:hypothetical protein [Desulfobacterales bacterium]